MKDSQKKQNLGCGKKIKSSGQFCGIPNAWGEEYFCPKCKMKMKKQWDEEDKTSSDPRVREIYKLRKDGKLNY